MKKRHKFLPAQNKMLNKILKEVLGVQKKLVSHFNFSLLSWNCCAFCIIPPVVDLINIEPEPTTRLGAERVKWFFFFAIRQFLAFFWLFSLPCPKCFAMTITSCDLYNGKASRPRAQNARVLSVGKKKIRSWLSRPTKTTAGCVDGMGTSLFKLARP